MQKIWWVVGVVVIVGLAWWGFSSQPQVATGEPIKIGADFSLTSYGASWAENNRDGAQLAVDEINADGGVLGRPLQLIVEDNESEVRVAISAFNKLVDVDKVQYVLTGWTNFVTPLIPLTADRNVIQVTVSAGAPGLTKQDQAGNLFRTYPSDSFAVEALVDLAVIRGWKRIAIARSIADWETGLRNSFVALARDKGITIVVEEEFQSDATDIRSQAAKVMQSKPDAIFAPINTGPAAVFIHEMVSKGMKVPILYPADFNTPGNTDNLSDSELKYVIYAVAQPSSREFTNAYKAKYGKEPGISADTSYDAVYALAKAIEKARTPDVTAVKQVLRELTFDGASGTIKFDQSGDRVKVGAYRYMTFGANKSAVEVQ